MADERNGIYCSFCGKRQNEVDHLFAGNNGLYICSECVELCHEIVESQAQLTKGKKPEKKEEIKVLTPEQIKAGLDEYVIGQDAAKKTLAVAVYNHYKRLRAKQEGSENHVELQKSNILMLGPTGVGKTMLAQTLAKMLGVPFAIADATTLTEAGYVGEDVENILLRLIQAADFDIERAQRGIIYLDELDKISRKNQNPCITRDVSGEGVQQALLKMIEGTVANVPPQGGRKHPQQECIQIDTTDILFICGGAFEGIEKIIESRVEKTGIGFGAQIKSKREMEESDILSKIEPRDLVRFGIIPELVGRLPIITSLKALDEDALVRILEEPKNAVTKQYKELLEMDGVKLSFEKEALVAIAAATIQRKTGARGLRGILESILADVMFKVPSDPYVSEVVITKECVKDGAEPTYVRQRIPRDKKFETLSLKVK